MSRGVWMIGVLVWLSLIFTGCRPGEQQPSTKSESKKITHKPASTGNAGELLIVIPDLLWNGDMGDAIKDCFAKYQRGLPQPEPLFDLMQRSPDDFKGPLRSHRNILEIQLSQNVKAAGLSIKEDLWVENQLYMKIVSPSKSALVKLIDKQGLKILEKISQKETDRLISNFRKNPEVSAGLKTKHNLDFKLGHGSVLMENKKNFAWIKRDLSKSVNGYKHAVQQGILIYHYPYTDTNTFTDTFLIAKRNAFLKKYVPGPKKNSFMITELMDGYEPVGKSSSIGSQYAFELRGLWKMENYFMGGPFISYTFLDKKRNRVVTVEGYLYAPQFQKREYLREVEAMAKSVRIFD